MLDNRPFVRLVEELTIDLYDELGELAASPSVEVSALAEHLQTRIEEILQRSQVDVIRQPGGYNRRLHQVVAGRPGEGPIERVVSPGFAIGPRVFRRAQVALGHPSPNQN